MISLLWHPGVKDLKQTNSTQALTIFSLLWWWWWWWWWWWRRRGRCRHFFKHVTYSQQLIYILSVYMFCGWPFCIWSNIYYIYLFTYVFSTVVSKCVFLLLFLDIIIIIISGLVVILKLEPLKLMSVYLFIRFIQIALKCMFLRFPRSLSWQWWITTVCLARQGSPQDLLLDFGGTAECCRSTGRKSATAESKCVTSRLPFPSSLLQDCK